MLRLPSASTETSRSGMRRWPSHLRILRPGCSISRSGADSVNTGSTRKDDKLKGKDCFDVEEYPYITFQSTKIVQTGLRSFDVPGTFTMRGISKAETLTFTADREGEGTGEIQGTLRFDRKDFGLGGHVHFVTIADRVELIVDFTANRISGSPL